MPRASPRVPEVLRLAADAVTKCPVEALRKFLAMPNSFPVRRLIQKTLLVERRYRGEPKPQS